MSQDAVERVDMSFTSRGARCAAWFYRPGAVAKPPVVIMAHGFGAEKTFGLAPFAERFAQEGMAAFVFDYRCFGESEGEPRNLVHPFHHLQDWRAAIAHVRTLREIDPDRIALWGSSFGGGHVIVTASREPGVRAIVAQVPFVDPWSSLRMFGAGYVARSLRAGFRDLFRMMTFRRPYYIPVVGDPGTVACLASPDARAGFEALVPPGSAWKNECPARIALLVGFYRPMNAARRVACPALLVMAERDLLVDPAAVEKTAARMPAAELARLPVGHFDVYEGSGLEKTLALETAFLRENLSAPGPPASGTHATDPSPR